MNNNNTFLSFRQPKSAETDASFYIRIVSERIAITFREDGILDMLRSFLEKKRAMRMYPLNGEYHAI